MLESVDSLSRQVPEAVRAVAARLSAAGHPTYAVGGCLRNLLSGMPSRDFDLTTRASAEQILEHFPRAIPIGRAYGTVMVPTSAGPVDVTTFRAGSLLSDLEHRDFTVNALALDLREGTLIDPTGGREDLEAGILRCPGDPSERLADDPLRCLRAARFVATSDLNPDRELLAAMPGALPGLGGVAAERILRELLTLLGGRRVSAGLGLLRRVGAEAHVLAPLESFCSDSKLERLQELADPLLRLCVWTGEGDLDALLARLRISRSAGRRIREIQQHRPFPPAESARSDEWLRRKLAKIGPEIFEDLLQLAEIDGADPTLPELRARFEALRSKGFVQGGVKLAVDGREIMEILRCGPGPEVGRALGYLMDQVLAEPARNQPHELRSLLMAYRDAKDTVPGT